MIKDHEEDEFIAVRVQDPRVQNEGSWNSYVDFKIFLHTNSKAFTAKTSCVRRRYSEFVWLKKKLQKNTGLVPVPELPTKSFFSFSNEDFLEKRRKGLQSFLDKVLHMTVCLSDSQLHLFLQTQLPVGHILDCVHGHTPYTVTEAILTYASSNRGWTQEEGVAQEPSSQTAVSYESMESPAPHLPILQGEPLSPVTLTSTDPNELLADIHDIDTVELQFKGTETPFLNGVQDQEDNHVEEAVLGRPGPVETVETPLLGDSQRTNLEDVIQQVDCPCQQQTPVEVHCEADAGPEEEEYVVLVEEESHIDTTTETIPLTLSTPGPVPLTLSTPGPVPLTLSTPGPVPLTLSTPGPVPLTLSTPEPDSRWETTPIEVSCGAIDLGEVEVQVRDFYEETAQDEDGSREAVTEVVSHVEENQEGDSNVETAQVGDSPGEAVLWQDSQVDEAQDDHSDVETIQDEEDISLVKEAREGDRQDEDIPGEAVLEDVSQADEALEDNSQMETTPEEDHVKGTAMERQDSLEYMNNRDFYREICYEEEDQEDTTQDVEHSDDDTTQEVKCNDVTNQEAEHSDHMTQEVEIIDDTTQEKETPLDSAQPIGGQLDPAQEAERDEDISSVEDCDQEKDLGGEERLAEVSPDRGSHDNIEAANHVETIQETNGYMETTTEEIYSTGNTEEVDLRNTDTLLPKTHEGPAHEDRFPEVSDTKEGTNGVEEDIPYMTNSCAVKTPESVSSSGLDGGGDDVGQNDQEIPESNHFESLSSGIHCSEEGILPAVEADTDDIEGRIEDNVTQKNVP